MSVPVYSQSMFQSDKDVLHVCPYDPVHRVAASRFVRHLLKCRKQHPNAPFVKCHFNARHVVPQPELQLHLSKCPDRRMIENEINCERVMIDGDEARGDTSVPPYSTDNHFDPDAEDWDREIAEDRAARVVSNRIIRPSNRYTWNEQPRDDPFGDPDVPEGLRPAQTSQPFPMNRRPMQPPQVRSGVVGMGRGRQMNRSSGDGSQQTKPSVASPPRPGGNRPQMAANFQMKPRAQEEGSPGSAKNGPVRSAESVPKRLLLEDNQARVVNKMIATQETDEEFQREISALTGDASVAVLPQAEENLPTTASVEAEEADELEKLRKEKRKLSKALKQIKRIEEKLQADQPVNSDELMKLNKKPAVEARLVEIELDMELRSAAADKS